MASGRYQARIVNYADDFVILCRYRADKALVAMRDMYVDGLVGIANGDNPRIIEGRLQGYFL